MNRYALSFLNRSFDPEALDGSIPQIFNRQYSSIFNLVPARPDWFRVKSNHALFVVKDLNSLKYRLGVHGFKGSGVASPPLAYALESGLGERDVMWL